MKFGKVVYEKGAFLVCEKLAKDGSTFFLIDSRKDAIIKEVHLSKLVFKDFSFRRECILRDYKSSADDKAG